MPTPAPTSHPRQALLAARPPPLLELTTPSPPCPARDCAALASPELAPVLALAVASFTRAATTEARGPVSDRHHGAREPPLGHRADPRRAAQARHRRECPLHPPLPTSWASSAAQPELAHLPRQPCPGHLGSCCVRGSDPDLPDPLRLLSDQPRPAPPAPLRRDRSSDRRLGVAPDDRSHALGPAPRVPLLIFGRSHLERVLAEFIEHYHRARPHQGLEQQLPRPPADVQVVSHGEVVRQDRLGGLKLLCQASCGLRPLQRGPIDTERRGSSADERRCSGGA